MSTEEQAREGHYSLDYQEQLSRSRVSERGWQVAKVRKDVASGKSGSNRPGYQELLEDIKDRRIDAVVVYKLDRLSRSVRDVYSFIELIQRHGVDFVSLNEGFDTSTSMGRAAFGISAVFAQLTRETIAENVTSGLRQRTREGKAPGGRLPYGYRREAGGLVVNPAEAEIIQMMFRCYVDEKLGLGRTTQRLNAVGYRTRGNLQWQASPLSRILRNPVYKGMVRASGITAPGVHEPIVSAEVFDAAQERLEANSNRLHPRTRAAKLLLLGVARCGYCGRLIRARYTTAASYYCTGNQSVGAEHCPGFMKQTTYVDDLVIRKLAELAANPEVQQLALSEAAGIVTEELSPLDQERGRLQTELAKFPATFTRWADRLDQGLIDEHQFAQRNQDLMQRKQLVSDRLDELERSLARRDKVAIELDQLKAALADFANLWQQGTLDERKEVVRRLVETLEITRDTVTIKIKFMAKETLPLPRMRARGGPKVDRKAADSLPSERGMPIG